MRLHTIAFLLLTLSVSSLPMLSLADARKEFYIQQALDRYYPLPTDARGLSLGGSADSAASGSIATFLNPAGLGRMKHLEGSLTGATSNLKGNEFLTDDSIEQSENRGHAIVTIPLGDSNSSGSRYGAVSFAYSRYQGETDDEIATTPDGHRRTIAYGYALSEALALGYTFTFYDDQLNSRLADLHSHSRILHIFGAQYELAPDVTLGALFKLGIGQSDTEDYIKQSDGLSKLREHTVAFGVTKRFASFALSGAIDFSHMRSKGNLVDFSTPVVIGGDEEGEVFNIRIGAETDLTEKLKARAGLRSYNVIDYEFTRADLQDLGGSINAVGLSLGAGYTFTMLEDGAQGVRLDYGLEWLNTGDGEWEHRLSLIVPFA